MSGAFGYLGALPCKDQFPLRKISIELDFYLVLSTPPDQKKLGSQGCGSQVQLTGTEN